MIRILFRIAFWVGLVLALILGTFAGWAVVREKGDRKAQAPSTGYFVQVGDLELFVQEAGDPKGRPIILVHGALSWSEEWRATMDVLAPLGYRVIAPDMPPFGYSERPWDRSYWRESQGRRLVGLVQTLKLEKPILVAHSYGARGALEAVLSQEHTFAGLILVNPMLDEIYAGPMPDFPNVADMVLSYEPFKYALTATTLTNPLLASYLLPLVLHKKEVATESVLGRFQQPLSLVGTSIDLGYWAHGFLAGDDSGPSRVRGNLAKIKIPVRLLWGSEDSIAPLTEGRSLVAYIRTAHLDVLEGVGHVPQLEDPSAFNAKLVEVLTGIPR